MNDDYDRAEDYIENMEDYIEFEYDKTWEQLSRKEKIEVIHNKFYDGLPAYRQSASDLLDGIQVRRQYEGEKVTISRFKIRGYMRTYVRDMKGRFRSMVR